jgi:hypothetical protein
VRHHRQPHKGENRGGGGGGLPTAELGTVRRKQTKGRGLKYGARFRPMVWLGRHLHMGESGWTPEWRPVGARVRRLRERRLASSARLPQG